MLRLIYGTSGAGKTEYILSRISEDARAGRRAFFILPEQQAVAAERMLLMRLPPSAQLTVEVLNFSRLCNRVFRECGGLIYNYATDGIKQLTMLRALKSVSHILTEYGKRPVDSRLAEAMLGTVKELRASSVTPEMLDAAAGGLPKGSPLASKLHDISAVYAAYRALLSEHYSDSADDIPHLTELLSRERFFAGASIYIDSFSSFTGEEHRLIAELMAQADDCTVTLDLPSPRYDGIYSRSMHECQKRLRLDASARGVEVELTELGCGNRRARSRELAYISDNLWEMSAHPYDGERDGGVHICHAEDVYTECEEAAATVASLIGRGMRCRDIVILPRDSEKYRGIIDAALEKLDIPVFISDKTDFSSRPLSRLILSALRVKSRAWQREDVIANLKTGLTGIDARAVDLFEYYAARHKLSGRRLCSRETWTMHPDGYRAKDEPMTERAAEILTAANEVKEQVVSTLSHFFSELDSAKTTTEMCRAVVGYLDALGVSDRLISLAARELSYGRERDAGETLRLYESAIAALEEVADAFSDEKPDLELFYDILKCAFAASELGTIPTSPDEVTVGSASTTRTDEPRATIILGAVEGEFPATGSASGLLTDSDREQLSLHDIPLSGGADERTSEELYYFKRAISSPTEELYIFTHSFDAQGVACRPSFALERVKLLLGASAPEDMPLASRLAAPSLALEYYPLLKDRAEGEALRRLYSDHPELFPAPPSVPGSLSAEGDSVPPSLLREHYGSSISLSQSRIECFNRCRFEYWCKYILKLDSAEANEFSANHMGTLVHRVLERYFATPADMRAPVREEVGAIVDSYIDSLPPDEVDARLRHTIKRLSRLSGLMVDDLDEEFSGESSFKPTYFEFGIGTGDIPPIEYTLKDGMKVKISGVIDRVDIFEDSGDMYIRVVDYKTGTKKFSLGDISEGKNLQLLLYIHALCRKGGLKNPMGGRVVPASIAYLSANIPAVPLDRPTDSETVSSLARESIERSGLMLHDERVMNAVSRSRSRHLMMGVRFNNDGSPSKTCRSLVDEEGMDELCRRAGEKVTEVADSLMGGEAYARPSAGGDSCRYCPYAALCRAARRPDEKN